MERSNESSKNRVGSLKGKTIRHGESARVESCPSGGFTNAYAVTHSHSRLGVLQDVLNVAAVFLVSSSESQLA